MKRVVFVGRIRDWMSKLKKYAGLVNMGVMRDQFQDLARIEHNKTLTWILKEQTLNSLN